MLTKKRLLFFTLIIGTIYGIYLMCTPVTIVGVHHSNRDTGRSSLLVKNFPLTKAGKIAWWEKNKIMLKEKYDIPKPDSEGDFHVTFWDFGDGYKKMPETDQGSDLRCFEDMQTEENCIEKNNLFEISKSRNLGLLYY